MPETARFHGFLSRAISDSDCNAFVVGNGCTRTCPTDPRDDPLVFQCCCKDVVEQQKKIMTVYHQSSPKICQTIMESNFTTGGFGWCGKGIYFAMTPQGTRRNAVAAGSHGGCMIKAQVDVGHLKRFQSCGAYNSMSGTKLKMMGYDTIVANPGTGDEIIVFDPERVVSKEIIPFHPNWYPRKYR